MRHEARIPSANPIIGIGAALIVVLAWLAVAAAVASAAPFSKIGETTQAAGGFTGSGRIAADSTTGYLFQADTGDKQIQIFKPTTGGIAAFGSPSPISTAPLAPQGLAVDSSTGGVYATVGPINEIQTIRRIPSSGSIGGTYTICKGDEPSSCVSIAATANVTVTRTALESLYGVGNVLVAGSAANPKEVTFQSALASTDVPTMLCDGTNLTPASSTCIVDETRNGTPGKILKYLPDNHANPTAYTLDGGFTSPAKGAGSGQIGSFVNLVPLTVDPTGAHDILVADTNQNKIKRYGSNGTFKEEWDGSSSGTAFGGLKDVKVNSQGKVFVSDAVAGTPRVVRFDANGTNATTVATSVLNTLGAPLLEVDTATDELFVTSNAGTTFPSNPQPLEVFQFDSAGAPAGSFSTTNPTYTGSPVGFASTGGSSARVYLLGESVGGGGSFDLQIFAHTQTLTVTPAGGGSGKVSADFGAISNCSTGGGVCTGPYEEGKTVTLTATPEGSSVFAGWSGPDVGSCDTTGATVTCPVAMTAAKAITATFNTPAAPTVTTNPATAIGKTAATLNGSVNPNASNVTECKFEWGLTESYGETAPCSALPGAGTSPVPVSAGLTGLSPGTTYHYKLVATNGIGTNNGGDQAFTTNALDLPIVATDPEGTVTQTTAVLNGKVDNEGVAGGSACSFQVTLATDTTYTSATTVPCTVTPINGTTNTAVTATATSLAANTDYIYRVRAVNSEGTGLGSSEPFSTLPNAPVVTTESEGTVAQTTAVLNGKVDNEGAAAGSACSFQVTLATDTTYASATTVPCTVTPIMGTTNTAVTATATSLAPNTAYIYRVRATNAGGGPINGTDEPFSTLPNAPVVTTESEGTVAQTTAVLNGKVDNEGAAAGSACSFQVTLATDTTYTSATTVPCTVTPIMGTTNTAVAATATGLTANTAYIYRVRATNAGGGPINGSSEPFSTLPNAPVVTTDAEGTVAQTTAVLNGKVDNEGAAAGSACSFQVTLATDPTYASATTVPCTVTPIMGTTNTAVTATATGLTANTAYIYRVRATNAGGGPINGLDEGFTTPPNAPVVTTDPEGTVTQTTAVLNGKVDNEGAAAGSACSFQVTLATDTTYASATTVPCTVTPINGTVNTAVTATATSLTPNTNYIYRIRATSTGGGPINGSSRAFSTLPNAPVVTTDPEGTVAQTTAVLNGKVDNEGAAAGSACSFQVTLATDTTYASATTVPCTVTPIMGTTNTAVTATATGLTANTAYIYRVRATNAGGGPINGTSEPFSTLKTPDPCVIDPASCAKKPTCETDVSLCPKLTLASTSATYSGGKAALQLTCTGTSGTCTGTATLTAKLKVGKKLKTVKIGKASYTIAAGQTGEIKVPLTGLAKKQLKKGKTVKATLTATGDPKTGGTVTGTVKIKPSKSSKK